MPQRAQPEGMDHDAPHGAPCSGGRPGGQHARRLVAQAPWPDRPVRFIVPFPPGGAADIVGRMLAAHFQQVLRQPFVVENRPGAGSSIGVDALAKAAPDGHTIGLINIAANAILPAVRRTPLPYDPLRDFAPMSNLAVTPALLLVNPQKLPDVRSVADLVAAAKARPGAINYGSSGVGSSLHLGMELFQQKAGIQLTHVPFTGGGPMLQAILAGTVEVSLDVAATTSQLIQEGRIRPLATTMATRMPGFPDLPALNETYPGAELASWHGLAAPAGTPAPIAGAAGGGDAGLPGAARDHRGLPAAVPGNAGADQPRGLRGLHGAGAGDVPRVWRAGRTSFWNKQGRGRELPRSPSFFWYLAPTAKKRWGIRGRCPPPPLPEQPGDRGGIDILDPRRLPLRRAVLVHQHRPHALGEVRVDVHHHARQRQLRRQARRPGPAARRAAATPATRTARSATSAAGSSACAAAHSVPSASSAARMAGDAALPEAAVDRRRDARAKEASGGVAAKRATASAPSATSAARSAARLGARHEMRRQPGMHRIRPGQPRAGQRQPGADRAGQARQHVGGADIGEQRDRGLGHRDQRVLGDDDAGRYGPPRRCRRPCRRRRSG